MNLELNENDKRNMVFKDGEMRYAYPEEQNDINLKVKKSIEDTFIKYGETLKRLANQ